MKPLVPLVLLFLLLSPLSALTFDLKTKVSEKVTLSPAKWGAEFFLVQAGHTVLDLGEDWAIWLKDRQVKISGDTVTVKLLVQISETTGIVAKPILAETWVTYTYQRAAPTAMDTDDAATKFLRIKLQNQGVSAWEEGRVGGAVVAKAILELANRVRG